MTLQKELKILNSNYAASVEENDALLDELESAKANIQVLTRNNDREKKSIKHELMQHQETIAILQVSARHHMLTLN